MENDIIKSTVGATKATPQRVVTPQKSTPAVEVKNTNTNKDVVDIEAAIHGKTGIDEDTGTVFYQKIKGDRIIVQIPTETEIKLAQEAKKIAEELLGNLIDETV